jgi:hypothetical protein
MYIYKQQVVQRVSSSSSPCLTVCKGQINFNGEHTSFTRRLTNYYLVLTVFHNSHITSNPVGSSDPSFCAIGCCRTGPYQLCSFLRISVSAFNPNASLMQQQLLDHLAPVLLLLQRSSAIHIISSVIPAVPSPSTQIFETRVRAILF